MTGLAPGATTEVEMAGTEQGIVVFDGSGLPMILMDSMSAAEVADLITEPVARRVLAARLRGWAEILDAIIAAEQVSS